MLFDVEKVILYSWYGIFVLYCFMEMQNAFFIYVDYFLWLQDIFIVKRMFQWVWITGYIHCEKNVSVSTDYRIYSLRKERFCECGLLDIFIVKRMFQWVRIVGYVHCEKNVSVSTDYWIYSLWKDCFCRIRMISVNTGY